MIPLSDAFYLKWVYEWKCSVHSDLWLITNVEHVYALIFLPSSQCISFVIHVWTGACFSSVFPLNLVSCASQLESVEEVSEIETTEWFYMLRAASTLWIPRDPSPLPTQWITVCFSTKKEMCSCLLLPLTLEFFFPFPSAFCVKKFCLNNYLSVPFAHSQHHHSSTFCFQLVLISNGLLVSICSQHH